MRLYARLIDPPITYTHQIVLDRMVEAFQTLRAIPMRLYPDGYGAFWPEMTREADDAKPKAKPVRMRPGGEEISRMEEALRWPLLFLGDQPKAADSLNVWASHKATGERHLEFFLQERAGEAAFLAGIVERVANSDREDKRRAIAAEIARWARIKHFLSDGSPQSREKIVANALIRLERELRKANLLQRRVIIAPWTMSPDKAISYTTLTKYRDIGALAIVRALEAR